MIALRTGMDAWSLIVIAGVLAFAGYWTYRRRHRAAPVVASAWAAVFASLGVFVAQALKISGSPGLSVLFAFVGALLGHWSLRKILSRTSGDPQVARRWARVERGVRTGELAAALAHEIKNPLTPIRGYARLLLRDVDAVEERERAFFTKALGIIDAEAERIERRVRRALERARNAAPEPVHLPQLLEEVVSIVAVEPGVTRVDVDLAPELPPIRAFEDGLQGALVNLFENAAEAMREGPGPIQVIARHEKGQVRVVIRDRGPGLGNLDQEVVMQSFFTTKADGTGLGLKVARSAVESIGGELSLRNRRDGPGAEAELILPVWLA